MRTYRVRLQKGGMTQHREVTAQSQSEAYQMAEATCPGYKAKGSVDLGVLPRRR